VRAFTILEILVGIALMVVVAALALPAVDRLLEARRFDAASDGLVSRLVLARSSAQTLGDPVEVMCDKTGTQICVKPLAAENSDDDETSDEGAALDIFHLPKGVRLEAVTEELASAEVSESAEADDEMDEPAWRRLAVYASDGSAIPASAVRLVDDAGRSEILRFNAMTGMPSVGEEGAPTHDAAPDEPAADEIAEPDAEPAEADGASEDRGWDDASEAPPAEEPAHEPDPDDPA
jgi:hypothetical protein